VRRRPWFAAGLGVAVMVTLGPTGPAHATTTYPFQNPRLPLTKRVDDLLGRLTLDEKVSLLHQYEPAIPRLGVKPFKTGTEALHGVAWSTDVHNKGAVVTAKGTVFPQAVGLASTWNPDLIKKVGTAVGTEARGYNSVDPDVWGVQLWAPVVNLLRDPRWGRNEEGYSEDPYLTGAISTAYGSGIEGPDLDHLRAAPVLKHYLAYNNEVNRDTTSSEVPPRVLNDYDRKAFSAAISSDAATGVMASYNLVNGRPSTVNPDLAGTERSWTDRTLLNVTDAGAPNNLTGSEKYYATQPEADAATLKAGIDSFTVDDTDGSKTAAAVKSALAQGLLTESDVDTAVRHILNLRFRLGDFDPDGGPYGKITKDVVNSPANQALERRTADQAQVLLKNSGNALPLDAKTTKKVAVVGPLEKTLYTDWYSGSLPYTVTPLDGIKERLGAGGTVTDSEGADRIAFKDVKTGKYITAGTGASGAALRESATGADPATQFDAFDWGQGVLTLRSVANGKYAGLSGSGFVNDQAQPNGWYVQQQFKLEKQGDGTYAIRYAGYETDESWFGDKKYLGVAADGTVTLATAEDAAHFTKDTVASGVDDAVKAAKGADAAVVVVGSMPFINGREAHDRTSMALAEGQEALVKAVEAANPHTIVVVENSYPTTLDWEQANVPAILWTTHAGAETGHAIADTLFGDNDPAGRLTQTWYRAGTNLPDILDYDIVKSGRTYLYYQGSPLYPFGYGLSYTTFAYRDLRASVHGATVDATVRVTNTGERAGDEVVQLYSHQRTSRDKEPLRQLRAFQRVRLDPGRTATVHLTFPVSDLAHWDVTRGREVVESATYDLMAGGSSADVRQRAAVRVDGETIPPRNLARTTPATAFDDYQGVRLVDESKARGDAVGAVSAGGWLKFADASLGSGASTFTARVAKASAGDGSIEVRLGSPGGPLAGTAKVASTGDVYTYATTTAALHGAHGRQDVYLVFHGDLRLADFSIG
jgi:beta-glucosidase